MNIPFTIHAIIVTGFGDFPVTVGIGWLSQGVLLSGDNASDVVIYYIVKPEALIPT